MGVVVVCEDDEPVRRTRCPVGTNIGWTTLLTRVIAMQRSKSSDRAVEPRAPAPRTATSARDTSRRLRLGPLRSHELARPARMARRTRGARSIGQSRKSITQRDGEPSGRWLRSSPTRYGRTTSALRGSAASIACGLVGREDEAHADDDRADERAARGCAWSRCALPPTGSRIVSDGVIPPTSARSRRSRPPSRRVAPTPSPSPGSRRLATARSRSRGARSSRRSQAGRARPPACRPGRPCSSRSARIRRSAAAAATRAGRSRRPGPRCRGAPPASHSTR